MKTNLTRLAFLLSALLLILASCNKDPFEVGYDLLPGSDTIHVKADDTATVIAFSLLQDSIRTDRRATNLIGAVNDPVFGATTATFCTQFLMSAESPDMGTNPVLDSVVLQMGYAGFYGDTNTMQTLNVYELSEDMHYDSAYFSNHSLQNYGNLLGTLSFMPRPSDSVMVGGVKSAPQIRINLSKLTHYFGNKLLSAPEDVMASNLKFLEYMKGLSIQAVPVSSKGAFFYVNYKSVNTKLVLYFKNSTDDSLHFDYVISEACARANFFNHNGYADASPELKNQILNHDTTGAREKMFLQGLGGVQIKVRLPNIKAYNNLGKIAINNARLVLTNIEADTASYQPVPSLYIVKKDSAGRIAFLIDYSEGTNYFGGQYDAANNTYYFRITRHIEQILQGKIKNYDLYIMAQNPASNILVPNRTLLNGTNPSDPNAVSSRFRLEITYTKLQ